MRRLIRNLGVIVSLAGALLGAPDGAAAAPVAGGSREAIPLAAGWKFHFGEVDPSVTTDGFDDSAWSNVSVPLPS